MEWIELGELVEQIRGVTYKKNDTIFEKKVNYVPIIRANNIQNFKFDYSDVLYLNFDKIKKEQYIMDGDIIIASSSGSKKIVGKAVQAKKNMGFSFGAFCKLIRVNNIKVNNRYVGYYFNSNKYRNEISNLAEGANINNIRNEHIDNLKIPVPSLEIQKQIVNILDKAQEIIDKRKEQIKLLDNLIESIFYHMFGDPVRNEKGWEVKKLGDLGTFKNGLNYSKEDKGYNIKCLGVGDFLRLNKIDNMYGIQEINVLEKPNADYLLKDEDILFVRSNGNKKLVGRNIIVFPGKSEVTFSGFCIRFRKNIDDINFIFLNFQIKRRTLQNKLQSKIRGANIQNLNQKILSDLDVILPPISLQNDFAKKVEVIEDQKKKLSQSLELMEENYKSIMDKAFKGQLF